MKRCVNATLVRDGLKAQFFSDKIIRLQRPCNMTNIVSKKKCNVWIGQKIKIKRSFGSLEKSKHRQGSLCREIYTTPSPIKQRFLQAPRISIRTKGIIEIRSETFIQWTFPRYAPLNVDDTR